MAYIEDMISELRPLLKREVYSDLEHCAREYAEKMRTKVIRTEEGEQSTPDTLLSGDPMTQFLFKIINMLHTAAALPRDWRSKEVSLKGDDAGLLHTSRAEATSYVSDNLAEATSYVSDTLFIRCLCLFWG